MKIQLKKIGKCKKFGTSGFNLFIHATNQVIGDIYMPVVHRYIARSLSPLSKLHREINYSILSSKAY